MDIRDTKSSVESLRKRMPDIVVLDASDAAIEKIIGEHIFMGVAFALNYDGVPAEDRDAAQERHVAHMKAMQDLAKERYATTLN